MKWYDQYNIFVKIHLQNLFLYLNLRHFCNCLIIYMFQIFIMMHPVTANSDHSSEETNTENATCELGFVDKDNEYNETIELPTCNLEATDIVSITPHQKNHIDCTTTMTPTKSILSAFTMADNIVAHVATEAHESIMTHCTDTDYE